MSYSANQYNYATPLSSTEEALAGSAAVADKKYFTLSNNTLDGTFFPIEGDVGVWGSVVSDSAGVLSAPFVLTVTGPFDVNTFRLVGSIYCYPVDFTVVFYDGSATVFTITETVNDTADYVYYMSSTVVATHYVITVNKVSAANHVARIYGAYNPAYVKRSDSFVVSATCISEASERIDVSRNDTLRISVDGDSAVEVDILGTSDKFKLACSSSQRLINVHTRMKESSRKVYGKVYITYTDPMRAIETKVSASSTAHNSDVLQILDGDREATGRLFTLYDNDLSGDYVLGDINSQVGWVSGQVSDATGRFADPAPFLRIDFAERPVTGLPIVFDDSHGTVVQDFTVTFIRTDGSSIVKEFRDNTLSVVTIQESVSRVVSIIIEVTKISKPFYPVGILEVPVSSTLLYVGYKDRSDLISIDLLEELTYDDDIEALGGVSANEIVVNLDNSSRDFYFNNPNSLVSTSLTRNRKIVPWLGVEIVPGEIEWYTLGTFWSYSWDVPAEGLVAKVTGFDTIGFLDKTSFTNHHMQINKSIGQLIEYVLDDAKTQYDFVNYKIDPALYDIVIPYAWFSASSHTAALRKISGCYPVHIYCDRDGTICAAPQKLKLDFYRDVWADNTNVISKQYSSLFTTLPNVINVTVRIPVLVTAQELSVDDFEFDIAHFPTRTLNFGNPYVSDLSVTVDCDPTVYYTYAVYSWGIKFSFVGTGKVRRISCAGTVLDVSRNATVSRRNEDSIRLNGAVTRDIQSDFIQTSDLANELLTRLYSLSELDKYDVNVEYRGDIALTINDPVLLLNGIAPDNRYNIKRHELFWNGSLSGSAYLNT